MLYVTTRNPRDAFTVQHALTNSKNSEGGLFVPLHLPKLTEQEINRLLRVSFGQCVAEMLNMFFSCDITGWDVDFSVGRYPVRLEQLAHRILMAEAWHNPDWQYQRLEKNLRELMHAGAETPGDWVSVAIRMSILAGILGNCERSESGLVDISVVSGDFTLPVSAWYLRKMGFPVGNIICCCNENNQFWELLCNGQMHTGNVGISTIVPEADVALPINLERLLFACSDESEVYRYLDCCRTGSVYDVSDTILQKLRQGMFAGVISSSRVETTIPNVYKTHNYILSPAASLAYSGLLDYRAKTGLTRTAVVFCDNSPICDGSVVSKVMGIPETELEKLI